MKKIFGNSIFDVEHALSMYATSYCILDASLIYDKELLNSYMSVIEKCHIYAIGLLPDIRIVNVIEKNKNFVVTASILEKQHELSWEIPDGFSLKHENDKYFIENHLGKKLAITNEIISCELKKVSSEVKFIVKYIGQSYGKDGSRNAIDRLLKHETLQKISLKGIPAGHRLTLLLLEVQENIQLLTLLNPFAKDKDDDNSRIRAGVDKLYGTDKLERISLFEASFIRYFHPEYNIEFKNSFPSTSLKILSDCYKKDFSAVISEINFDELPFNLCSEIVMPAHSHIAKYDLHNDAARRAFFFGNT